MTLKLPGPLRDKRVKLAAGAGAAVGAVILVRRHFTGGGAGSSSTAGAPQSYPGSAGSSGGGFGSFSDGGAGISADLGNFQVGLQGILTDYTAQLTDTLSSLKAVPTGPSTPAKSAHTAHDAHAATVAHKAHEAHKARTKKAPPHPSVPVKVTKKPAPAPKKKTTPGRASTAAAVHTISTAKRRPQAIPVYPPPKVKKKT